MTVDVAGDAYVVGWASPDFPFTGGDTFAGIEPQASWPASIDVTMTSARAIGMPGVQYYARDLAVNDQNQIIVVAYVQDAANPALYANGSRSTCLASPPGVRRWHGSMGPGRRSPRRPSSRFPAIR